MPSGGAVIGGGGAAAPAASEAAPAEGMALVLPSPPTPQRQTSVLI